MSASAPKNRRKSLSGKHLSYPPPPPYILRSRSRLESRRERARKGKVGYGIRDRRYIRRELALQRARGRCVEGGPARSARHAPTTGQSRAHTRSGLERGTAYDV